jgi:putative intracellular protease/amidase
MSKRVLIVLSEYGYWGEELVGPLTAFDKAGYDVVFATPTGKKPLALPPSKEAGFVDPPLNKSVTSEETARIVTALEASDRLDAPLSLEQLVPLRPYVSSPGYLRELEAYNNVLDELQTTLVAQYDALLLVGGSGPMVDMANNRRVHDLILGFLRQDKPIGAECYGVACLAFAREWEHGTSILAGKRVTGHTKEYDWTDFTGVMGIDHNFKTAFYPLEFILRDATAPGGRYIGNFGKELSVVVDYPFITGRSTHDSYLTGEKMVAVLDDGLRRWGW